MYHHTILKFHIHVLSLFLFYLQHSVCFHWPKETVYKTAEKEAFKHKIWLQIWSAYSSEIKPTLVTVANAHKCKQIFYNPSSIHVYAKDRNRILRVAQSPAAFTTPFTLMSPSTALLLKHRSITKIKEKFTQLGLNPLKQSNYYKHKLL